MLLTTVGAKSSSSAVNTQASSSKPGTVPLVSATSRIIHPEEDTSLVSLTALYCLICFHVPSTCLCQVGLNLIVLYVDMKI